MIFLSIQGGRSEFSWKGKSRGGKECTPPRLRLSQFSECESGRKLEDSDAVNDGQFGVISGGQICSLIGVFRIGKPPPAGILLVHYVARPEQIEHIQEQPDFSELADVKLFLQLAECPRENMSLPWKSEMSNSLGKHASPVPKAGLLGLFLKSYVISPNNCVVAYSRHRD